LLIGVGSVLVAFFAIKVCGSQPISERVGPASAAASFAPAPSTSPFTTSAVVAPSGTIPRATAPSVAQVYPAATEPPNLPHPIGPKLRPMDHDIFERIEKNDMKRLDDVFPGKPYQVRMYRDAAEGLIYLVEIDLQRSGVWEERWELKKDEVTREVTHVGDRTYVDTFALRSGRWLPF
jgi:hypothetical protein